MQALAPNCGILNVPMRAAEGTAGGMKIQVLMSPAAGARAVELVVGVVGQFAPGAEVEERRRPSTSTSP